MYKQQKTAIALGVIAALGAAFSASAQQNNNNTAKPNDTEVIEVRGFRDSVIRAKDLKRESMVAQDSIVAEDIADFPDQNLADSLQRVPGIAITREGGEGRQISLRGLGPDFTRVQVNGMEALGTSSSPMDSRGAVGRSRAFDFNIFASELFNQIDVKKSYSADQEEGGIGGTVNLRTAKPFDYDGFQGAVAGQLGTNSNTDKTNPRVVGLISDTWGKFGALASVAFSQKNSSEFGSNTYRWRQVRATNGISSAIDADTAQKARNGELWFARGNRYSVWNNDQERLGITTALQYRHSDDLKFAIDYMYGRLENTLDEHHLSTGGASSTALGRIEELSYIDNNGDLEVVKARFSNSIIRTENRADYNTSIFNQVTISSDWQINDDLGIKFQLGTSSSDYDQPKVDKVNLTRNGGITTDYTIDRFYAYNTYDFNPAEMAGWTVKDIYFREDYITSDFDNAKVDFDYALNDFSTLTFGANYKKFGNVGNRREDAGYVETKATPLNNGVKSIQSSVVSVYGGHPYISWLQADVDALQKFYGIHDLKLGEDRIIQTNSYSVEEENSSLYSQYSWDSTVAGNNLRGSIGARYYKTDLTSKGVSQGKNVTVERDYSDILPTLNLVYELNDDLLLRFGASKNLTRPSLDAISVSANVAQMTGSPGEVGKITIGNPDLKPFESKNLDFAIEQYYEGVGSLSAAVFWKDIKNFIVTEVETKRFSEMGLPESLLPNGATVNSLFDITSPQNSDASTIKGAEFAFQRDFDFLPEPFNQLGLIANYTWVNGTTLYRNVQGTGQNQEKSFPGLSKNSYNVTFYYQAENYGARISAANRSKYINSVEGGLRDHDESGFHETTFVDFSAFYQFSENLKFTLEGINLTNQREVQYSDSNDRPYNTTTSGRTYSAGFSYKF
ncbi:MAG: TonB-dependent receptor [Rheinheimera sp.]